jgi:hypothetical protein
MMAKKWIAINLALLAVAVLLGRELRRSVQEFTTENNPARIQPVADGKQAAAGTLTAPGDFHPNADYSIIADNTIFSDLRGNAEEEIATVAPAVPPLAQNQKPILVGTMMIDDPYQALMIDPTTPLRNGRRYSETKRVGDSYRGYTITSIVDDQIVLENGARREVIPLHGDTRKSTPAAARQVAATRVVSIGPGGAGARGALTSVTSVRGVPAPPNAQPRPGQPVRNPQNAPVAAGAAGQIRPPVVQPGDGVSVDGVNNAPGQVLQTPPNQQPKPPRPAQQGGRVIRSPFGDVIRPGVD